MNLPEGFELGKPGSGNFAGILPIQCQSCNKTVAFIRFDEPIMDSQYRALISLAQQFQVPACIDFDDHIRQFWPASARWDNQEALRAALAHEHQ